MTTFSQAVDRLIAECQRPDMKLDIVDYLNQTIRELHLTQDGTPIKYNDNLVEEEVTSLVDENLQWTIPYSQRFQGMEAVWYSDSGKYARLRKPSTAFVFMDEVDGQYYYYRTGQYYAFSGFGATGSIVKLSYFLFPRRLTYYPVGATRPCTWDEATQTFSYAPAYTGDPTLQANARELSTNWLFDRWEDMVKAGARVKLWNRLNNQERGKIAYSTYQELRKGLAGTETFDSQSFFVK